MIITFFGHSNYVKNPKHEEIILDHLESVVGDRAVDFYLGGYGNFDSFALSCAKKFQQSHPNAKIYFVTPYITESYEKNRLKNCSLLYDGIIYPPLENAPPKYAISHRNKWMVDKADLVIFFVTRSYGGAYRAIAHARATAKNLLELSK